MKNIFWFILILILVCCYIGFIYLSIRNTWKAKQESYRFLREAGAPDKPCGVGRADANPKLLLNDT